MIIVATVSVLGGVVLASWATFNAFRSPGRALAALAGAVVLLGIAFSAAERLGH